MGGRGSSSVTAGAGGVVAVKDKLELGNETVEFDGRLMYYGDDKSVTGKVRQNVEAWEDKRGTAKIEYAYSVDADGNPIGPEVKGGKHSVKSPSSYHDAPNSVFTHIHPREGGDLGGTFSTADLLNFAYGGNKTTRARAKEGTYSISKTNDFKQREFSTYVRQCERKFVDYQRQKHNENNKNYTQGKINYEEYIKTSNKVFNNALIELHNMYKSGEKQYGYKYTLEPLKKGK